MNEQPVGTCCLVLHTHLPWLAHHGAWPVGEEWLHQAWSASYLPVMDVLHRLANEGRRDLVSVGVTPIVAAQLDDAYCLREFHTWLGFWQTRAAALATRREEHLRHLAAYEFGLATRALETFETTWRHGGSSVLRKLADAGVIELLGGPATHPFLPLTDDRVARAQLDVGMEDGARRFGGRLPGMWAPECGYRPGLEDLYFEAGVRRFLVDGPTLIAGSHHRPHGHDNIATGDAWTVGASDVIVFGRDLDVTYRIWSPRRGYPGGRDYRDFHTFDHASGIRPARVTSTHTPPADKAPYDPARGHAAIAADAADFVRVVRSRLLDLAAARGRPGVVVAAYDTELFGHWWHEGPLFLEHVLRSLPAAGVHVATLGTAIEEGAVAGRIDLPTGSWGAGKDWHVWSGEQVRDITDAQAAVRERLLRVVDKTDGNGPRRPDLDQLAREAFLTTSSDWAFMVTHDSAASYARERAQEHARRFHALADRIEAGREATRLTSELRADDGPFGHLDARILRRTCPD
ncbi:MAG: 1,4-alpha-glucan branching protein domain-containing protein [Actinomycetes bacterium]